MRDLRLTTSVNARPDEVWATVADFDGYPAWHPLVHWIRVRTDWSTKVTARVRIKRTTRLSGSLIEHDPPSLINWDASHRIWGLLRVRYTLRISPTAAGSDVIQSVRVTGWLSRLVPAVLSSLPDALAETAHALKREIEREPAVRSAA
jgi:hypothetical protein